MSGAQPKLHGSKVTNKPEFTGNWDIDRSGPRALHIGLNKYPGSDLNLNNNDIEGSRPKCVQFNSTRQYNDPLNPQYALPQVEMRPITPPKFVRDAIGHDDIEGSKPKKQTYYQTRDIMKLEDIEGSKPRNLTKTRATSLSNIDY